MDFLDTHRPHGPHHNGKGLLTQEVSGAYLCGVREEMREKNGFYNENFVINMLNMKINFYF